MTREIRYKARSVQQRLMLIATLVSLLTGFSLRDLAAQEAPGATLEIGGKIPALSGVNQFGKAENFGSLKGPNGLVLLFFRSADW